MLKDTTICVTVVTLQSNTSMVDHQSESATSTSMFIFTLLTKPSRCQVFSNRLLIFWAMKIMISRREYLFPSFFILLLSTIKPRHLGQFWELYAPGSQTLRIPQELSVAHVGPVGHLSPIWSRPGVRKAAFRQQTPSLVTGKAWDKYQKHDLPDTCFSRVFSASLDY